MPERWYLQVALPAVAFAGMDKERAAERIDALAAKELDLLTFWDEVKGVLEQIVPHYMAPCWQTLDPASLLVTCHYDHGLIPQLPNEWLAHEYYEDDYHKLCDVARSQRGISTGHEATGGDPSRSPAWKNFVAPYGGDQELYVALRTRSGETWGVLALYREKDRPLFDQDEFSFLKSISVPLGEAIRRGLLVGEASDPEGPDAPGLLVITEDWAVESMTPGVDRWLSEMPGGDPDHNKLPPAVLAVAGRALRTTEGAESPGEVSVSRVLSQEGRWMVLHGAALVTNGAPRVAVIIEPAHPARITSLLMRVYELSEREQEVTRLVLAGNSTTQIAQELFVSPHTVQQHLKNIFEKTGVRSRRELVGKVFFGHYEPRLRDNERRAIGGAPLRGGPVLRSDVR